MLTYPNSCMAGRIISTEGCEASEGAGTAPDLLRVDDCSSKFSDHAPRHGDTV